MSRVRSPQFIPTNVESPLEGVGGLPPAPPTTPHWVTIIPRRDLNLVHHALRMLDLHPMTSDNAAKDLADALWDESVRRGREAPR